MAQREVRGVGLGLRAEYAAELLGEVPDEVRWIEIHPENYVGRGGRFEANLEAAHARWPIVPHGLTLCFGTTERFEPGYVRELRSLLRRVGAPFYSDHLCWGGAGGAMLHDLLPLPFARESIDLAVQRARELRDALELPVAIENVSYYAHPGAPEMDEPTFVLEVLEQADCAMLLDVNNVWVNSKNHGFDPRAYIDRIPAERVVQIHVAGHLVRPDALIIDTHGEPICEGVYELLEHTLTRMGEKPVVLERDQNFPAWSEVLGEVRRLGEIYERATARSGPT